jgi:CHAT domain-containing protein
MLATRVKGDAGDATEDINKILFFCRELTSGASPHSPGYLTSALQALTQAVLDIYSRGMQMQSLDQVIGCLREALKNCSGLHQVSFDLANLLTVRFLVHHAVNDYEEAKVLLDHINRSLGDPPCQCRYPAGALTTALEHAQSIANRNLEDFEEEVSRCRSSLANGSHFGGDPLHSAITVLLKRLLASHAEQGSKHIGPSQGTQVAHPKFAHLPFSTESPVATFGDSLRVDGSGIVPAPLPTSSEENTSIVHLRDRYRNARPGTGEQRKCLRRLVRLYNDLIHHDTTFIDQAVKDHETLLAIIDSTDQSNFLHISNFGKFLYEAFNLTKTVKYLDEAITRYREVLDFVSARPYRFAIIQWLIGLLLTRWELHRRREDSEDLNEAMVQFESFAKLNDAFTAVPFRFYLACDWVYNAQISKHDSLLTAHKYAMSLMQSSLVFAPTLVDKHDHLVEKRHPYEKTPLNFASYHIGVDELDRAIEVLEHGRALLWSEMRGFRISTDQLQLLHKADRVLAGKFTKVNRELEKHITSAPLDRSVGTDDGDLKIINKLLKKREALIPKVRGLPGLERLLLPSSFNTLRSAASRGPVIVINHCEWRSDIIIIIPDSPPSLITTSRDFFKDANKLKEDLLRKRQGYGSDSKTYRSSLTRVLKRLYELVGKPVIERLDKLKIRKKSRVWWCPTSVFWYLPLHAMGPIPSEGEGKQYFSDQYISSYTSTLTALITSRNSGAQNISPPNMLLVAVPGPSLPDLSKDIQAIQSLNLSVTSLISENATLSAVRKGIREHEFCHFACHGVLNPEKPFSSALGLYNKEQLTLLDIAQSRLTAGECAFLAICSAAELSDVSMPDEVLHLCAAVQSSGFRSVIGTMWRMADKDGPDLAKYFYESIFSDKRQKVPYHERSAEALAEAVRRLRDEKQVTVERWVNYTHIGA